MSNPNGSSGLGCLELELPIPPSTNKIYIRTRHGGVCLSKKASEYREEVRKIVTSPGNLSRVCNLKTGDEVAYSFEIDMYFSELENQGWFKEKGGGEKGAKTRYKRIDYDNRIKFLQDCVAKSLSIDDCQIFEGRQRKKRDRLNPRAVVRISTVNVEEYLGV